MTTTETTTLNQSNDMILAAPSGKGGNMLTDSNAFNQAYRVARLFAASQLIPAHLKGKEADCFIALYTADRMKEDPLIVMQNMYLVSGRPGWHTQYMIGRANNSGKLKGSITWDVEGSGKELRVRAKGVLATTGEEITSPWVDFVMAEGEGWTKNSKYKSMPEVMFRYRSAAMLIRFYLPEVMLGYQTVEELETLPQTQIKDVTPAGPESVNTPATSKLDAFAATATDIEAQNAAASEATLAELDDMDARQAESSIDPETGEILEQSEYPPFGYNDYHLLNTAALKDVALNVQKRMEGFESVDLAAEYFSGINGASLLMALSRKGLGPIKQRIERELPANVGA
ncbi:MAG: hypothetical protein K2Q12_08200 [Rickettsiales bacterium]|nr:hypothetical protein [Rickettsiales bacterium]